MVSIIALLLTFSSDAQSIWIKDHIPARNRVSEESLRLKVEFMTDSICAGRGTGTRGGVETAAWIAREFEKSGLMKSKGTYYQRFQTEKAYAEPI